MKFYAQSELDQLYREMNQKPYGEKAEWEKFINDERSKQHKKERKRRQHEIAFEHIEQQEGKG